MIPAVAVIGRLIVRIDSLIVVLGCLVVVLDWRGPSRGVCFSSEAPLELSSELTLT